MLVDGRQRVVAAKQAGMLDNLKIIVSDYTCKSNREVINIMQILNNTQASWRLSEYISLFAKSKEDNHSSYEFLRIAHNNTKIDYECLACLCTGQSKSVVNRVLKKGEFKVIDKLLSNRAIVNFVTFMVNLSKSALGTESQCAIALEIRIYTKRNHLFDVEEFWKYLKTTPTFSPKIYNALRRSSK